MGMCERVLVPVAVVLFAAGPARADALLDQVLAAARAERAASYGFRRTVAVERTGQEPRRFVEQFDPRRPVAERWTLVSIDGRPPTAKETQESRKAKRELAPRYAEMIAWIGAPATRTATSPGSVTYSFASLPKGAFKIGTHDASASTRAEVTVNTAGRAPFVERVRMTTDKPFRMMLVAAVKSAVVTYSFAQMPEGHVLLTGSSSHLTGSMMGKSGEMRTNMAFADFRPET
jgi:hypothetical protein